MSDQSWDLFVIYVNAYYAVQEAYDSARRNWERPAPGLEQFCKDANPFLWDEHSSAEEEVFRGFSQRFLESFENKSECLGTQGYAFARSWLASLEGGAYGTELVASFDAITDERSFAEACEPIAHQIASRAMRLERTPQDEPLPVEPLPERAPSEADIDAVIKLLAKGDESFAAALRARLASDEEGA